MYKYNLEEKDFHGSLLSPSPLILKNIIEYIEVGDQDSFCNQFFKYNISKEIIKKCLTIAICKFNSKETSMAEIIHVLVEFLLNSEATLMSIALFPPLPQIPPFHVELIRRQFLC